MIKNVAKGKLTDEQLESLIEEATVDCYDEYECLEGFYGTLEEELGFPFEAEVVGETVKVVGIEDGENTIEAICSRNGKKYKINLLDLKYDPQKVKGYKWIEAYRKWAGN